MGDSVAAERHRRAMDRFGDTIAGVVGRQQLRDMQNLEMPMDEKLRLLGAMGSLAMQLPLDEFVMPRVANALDMDGRTLEEWLGRVVLPALQLTKGLGEVGKSLSPARNALQTLHPQQLRLGALQPEDAPNKLHESPLKTKVDIGADEIRGDVGLRAQLSTSPTRSPVVAAIGLHSPTALALPRVTSSLAFYREDVEIVLRGEITADPDARYAFRLGLASRKTRTEARITTVLDDTNKPRVIDARLRQRFSHAALSLGFVDRQGQGSASADVRFFLDPSAPYSTTVGLTVQQHLYGELPVAPTMGTEAHLNVRLGAF